MNRMAIFWLIRLLERLVICISSFGHVAYSSAIATRMLASGVENLVMALAGGRPSGFTAKC